MRKGKGGRAGKKATDGILMHGCSMVEAQTCKVLLMAATRHHTQALAQLRALEALAAGEKCQAVKSRVLRA